MLQPLIKKPCSENWDEMKIGINSRFCNHCDKQVVDFTNKSRIEILEYLFNHRNEKTCGRIRHSQLDSVQYNWFATVKAYSKQTKNSNLPFFILSVGSLLLASCQQNNSSTITINKQIDTLSIQSDKYDFKNIEKDSIKPTKSKLEKHTNIDTNEIMGIIDAHYNIPELYPEFIGGMDSLSSFIEHHLKYPDYEYENNIQGEVIAVMIIDENGKIKDPRINKTVEKSKNFDEEVLRVINLMPDWIPGKINGKNASIKISIPFSFELE